MKLKLIIVLIVCGALLTYAGFGDTLMLLKGTTINLNTASQSEYSEKALAEGDIYFVYGPFAELESTTTNYGVKHTDLTEFYLISGDENLEYFVVFSTADGDMINKLNSADAAWWDYLSDEEGTVEAPNISIPFKGKTFAQPSEDDYADILDDTLDELGLVSSDIAELRVVDTEVGVSSIVLLIVGILMFVGGVVWAVLSIRKNKQSAGAGAVE